MASRKTILVVDDDSAIREALADCLQDAGFDVVCAENGEQALRVLEATPPSLMLLDLMMPVMSGWELLEIIQASEPLSRVPIIVVSAMSAPGPWRSISKPVDLDNLVHAVEEWSSPPPSSGASTHA